MYAKFAARVPGIGQCRVIYRADAVNQFGAAQGNTAGGPLANGRSLALPGSKDCNQGSATPSDARGCRRIIVGPPQVVARRPAGAAWGTGQIARCEVASARPGAPSRVAHWGRNVPAVLGMKLSRLRVCWHPS